MSALERLASVVREEGGLLAGALGAPGREDPFVADAPAGEPDAAARERALVVAAVREGYLLHYAEGNVLRPDDPDLALLGGDRLYALGLARLAELGDLESVAILAELISECARAHAEDEPARAAVAWATATSAIGRVRA